jgi:hypothetical protein
MRSRRRLGIAVACVLVGVVPFLAAATASAAQAPKQARGAARCNISGKLSFSPPLTNSPQSVQATVKGKVSCPLAHTGSASAIKGGAVTISSRAYTATCGAPVPPSLTGSVKWKTSSGGKLIPSGFAFGAPASSAARPVHYPNGLISGSYGGGVADVRLNWPTACGAKGLKRTAAGGTISLSHCVRNIWTTLHPAQTEDGHIWWVVVAPDCGYDQTNHPTGTISWAHSDPTNIPACTGTNVPLQRVWPTEEYWGVHTGINLGALESCRGRFTVFRYSGDARFAPYIGA